MRCFRMLVGQASGAIEVASLNRIDDRVVLLATLLDFFVPKGALGDPHQALELFDHGTNDHRHAYVTRQIGDRAMERLVVLDAFGFGMISISEVSKTIQDLQLGCIGPRRRGGAGRFQEQAETEEILDIGVRNRPYPVTSSRQHRHKVLPLEAKQCVTNRGPAYAIAVSQRQFPEVLPWLELTSKD